MGNEGGVSKGPERSVLITEKFTKFGGESSERRGLRGGGELRRLREHVRYNKRNSERKREKMVRVQVHTSTYLSVVR